MRRACYKVGQIAGLQFEVVEIEDAFGEPAKESRHPVLKHPSPRTGHCGARQELVAQWDQLPFVAVR